MAQDPYGFDDAAPGASVADASRAMWFSVSSALLSASAMCFCYVPYLVAFPLGVYGAWLGSRVLSTNTEPGARSMATAGLVAGAVSAFVSGMVSLVMLLYCLFIVFAVMAGVAEGGGY